MAKWEEEVKKYFDEIIAKNNLSKLKFGSWMTNHILGHALILIAVVIILIACLFYITAYYYVLASIGVVITIVLSIVATLIFKSRSKISKIKDTIIGSLDFPRYYTLELKELSNDKYQLSSLSTFFDVMPINFLHKSGSDTIDAVLNFFCEDISCSYGTITNEIVTSIGDRKYWTYDRYCYLNLCLIQTTNLNAIIQPSQSFLKLFKTPDNNFLESTEFEQIYSVETDDQVMIRKVLKPKGWWNFKKSDMPIFKI